MQLKITTPARVCLDIEVCKILAEAPDGGFGLLPRHIDFVTQLSSGILVYEDMAGAEHYAGIGAGTLVKCGSEVLVSTRNAVLSDDLDALQRRVAEVLRTEDETERTARAALARLEAEMVRRFQQLEQIGP